MFSFRSIAPLHLVAALFLAGCAAEGIIVKKTFRPLPFSYSLGLDGIYKFQLEDQQKAIREQMVTRDVFVRYEVGDFFSDRMEGIRAVAENAQRDAARIGLGRLPAREANTIYEDEPLIARKPQVKLVEPAPQPVVAARKPEVAPAVHPIIVKPAAEKPKATPAPHAPARKPAVHPAKAQPAAHKHSPKAEHAVKSRAKTKAKPKQHSAAAAKAAAEEADAATSTPDDKPHFRGVPEPGTAPASRDSHRTLVPRDRPTTGGALENARDTEGF